MVRSRAALVCLLALGFALSARASAGAVLRLVDDRGQAVDEPLSICFQIELASQCADVRPGEPVPLPPSFGSVRAEGAHHGPVSVRDRDLHPANGGPPILTVPRKALLRIDKLPSDPLTLSAFRPKAESFRNPIFHGAVGAAGVEVPSGDLVLSLSARGRAPDLQRLTTLPGSQATVTYHPRDGWSLLVRCREAVGGGGAPVMGAKVSVARHTETTGGDGLALLAGLGTAEAVEVRHASYLPQELAPPPAEPGVFLVHEALLEKGGTVTAHVTQDKRPAAGTYCTVLASPAAGSGGVTKLSEGIVGADGLYRSGRLPAGSYSLRVSVAQSRSFIDQPFSVREGEDARLDVSLGSIRVSGRVMRGGRAAAGYKVEAVADSPAVVVGGLPALQATTDPVGEYHGTLWAPGDYLFHLRTEAGIPVATERRVSLGKPEEAVDFELSDIAVSGQVVDEKDAPVEMAQVTLSSVYGKLTVLSGQGGAFEILVEQGGLAVLSAQKTGLGEAPAQRVSIDPEEGLTGVKLVLRRQAEGGRGGRVPETQ
jgi:hypothetical protein